MQRIAVGRPWPGPEHEAAAAKVARWCLSDCGIPGRRLRRAARRVACGTDVDSRRLKGLSALGTRRPGRPPTGDPPSSVASASARLLGSRGTQRWSKVIVSSRSSTSTSIRPPRAPQRGLREVTKKSPVPAGRYCAISSGRSALSKIISHRGRVANSVRTRSTVSTEIPRSGMPSRTARRHSCSGISAGCPASIHQMIS